MNVEGRLYREGKTWVVDADPFVMGWFGRVFPKSALVHGPGTFTQRRRSVLSSPLAAIELNWLLQRFALDMTPDDRRALEGSVADHDAHLAAVKRAQAGAFERVDLTIPLRDYQQEGVALVAAAKRILIADDLGLGKSASAIGATGLPGGLPAVIVPPTHLTTQWKREIERFMASAKPCILGGKAEKAKGFPVATHYIVPYSRLAIWCDELTTLKPGTVVFDEVQELRHPETKKYEAAYRVSETARHAVGLSATPIVNYGDEIHTVLDAIRPGGLGGRDEFLREWCRGGGVVSDPPTLRAFLTRNGFMLRRRRVDVGRELDPVNPVVVTVDADLDELAKVEDIAAKLAQQALLGSFEDAGRAAREFDLKLRYATGMAKAEAVAQVVRQILIAEEDEKVVLFGWHHDVYAKWRSDLAHFKPVFYTGAESPQQKQAAVDAFLSDKLDAPRVFVMSLRSGLGLDGLQRAASTCVFGELDWSPSVHAQCVGRLARDGQTKPVNAVYVTVNDGADPPMMQILGLKRDQRDGIVDGVVTGLNDDEGGVETGRIQAAAEDFLKRRSLGMFAQGRTDGIANDLAAVIRRTRLPTTKESDMHAVLGPVLERFAGTRFVGFEAEANLSPDSRIDFLVGGERGVGIECKVKGSRPEVYRQVARYLEHNISALVLVCPWPLSDFTINGKPVLVVSTGQQALA